MPSRGALGDPLEGLSSAVRGCFGVAHEHHPSIGSTNDRAMAWSREGGPDGAVVTADHQSVGRGRRGRRWTSAPGANLCVSVIVRPPVTSADFGAVSLAAGLGIVYGLAACAPEVHVRLKWPNDLLVGGRKLGGVLCESRWVGSQPTLAVGFGVNVQQRDFGADLEGSATSLALEGANVGRTPLLIEILLGLERVLDAFWRRGFGEVREAYLKRAALLGERVLATVGERTIEGAAITVDEEGALLVEDGAGMVHRIVTGEVTRVRADSTPKA